MSDKQEHGEIKILGNYNSVDRRLYELHELSRALCRVGLRELGDEIHSIVQELQTINEDTRDQTNAVISRVVFQATENTNAVFGAAMAALTKENK